MEPSTTKPGKSRREALEFLFVAFDRNPTPRRLSVWADLVRKVAPETVWATVRQLCKDEHVRSLPSPGQFYAALRGRSMASERPTLDQGRKKSCVTLGSLLGDDEAVVVAQCEWVDGCGPFQTTADYLDRIKQLNRMPGPRVAVLCMSHAGRYLRMQAQRR